MGGVETFVILPVATFYFAIVSRDKGADDFVADPVCFQMFLEKDGLFFVCVFWFGDLNITHNEAISAFFILTCNTSIVILQMNQ